MSKHAGDAMPLRSWLQPATIGRHRKSKQRLIDTILEMLTGETIYSW